MFEVVNKNKDTKTLPGDNPIRDRIDDVLTRADSADIFAQQALTLDVSEGATIGLFGPWGSGKTSFVNLARNTFNTQGVPVLDFNPWLFSGTEQLVARFFVELSKSMGMTNELEDIGKKFRKYGLALDSVASIASFFLANPLIAKITKVITKIVGTVSQPKSVGFLRKEIEDVLQDRDKPIVVVLDDVDRLSAPEIREIFKLVRLTASFPNLIYLVSCDRLRVEQALDEKEQGLSGRDYLEKIIQWSFNLPEIPDHLLTQQLSEEIDKALSNIGNPGPFDEQVWSDIYTEIVQPLIRNMRDVRRYVFSIQQTVGALKGQVALVDVLALEAVRLFLPDVFIRLPSAIDGLTLMSMAAEKRLDVMVSRNPADPITDFNKWMKVRVDGLIEAATTYRKFEEDRTAAEVVDAMIDRLFPDGSRLRRMSDGDSAPYVSEDAAKYLYGCRVAHESILRLYLERVVGPNLVAYNNAERALARMTDRKELMDYMRLLGPTQWEGVVSNLCNFADQFRPEHAEPGALVLLNIWSELPELKSGSNSLSDTGTAVRQVISQLLHTLEDASAVELAVSRMLPSITSLFSKVELVYLVGHRERFGQNLVSKIAATEFETSLGNEVKAASVDKLIDERNLSKVLLFARNTAEPLGEPLDIPDTPEVTFNLLQSVCGEMTTGLMDSRAVRRSPTLAWETLVDIYGSKKILHARIKSLTTRFDELKPWLDRRGIAIDDAKGLLRVADKYLNDWQLETG